MNPCNQGPIFLVGAILLVAFGGCTPRVQDDRPFVLDKLVFSGYEPEHHAFKGPALHWHIVCQGPKCEIDSVIVDVLEDGDALCCKTVKRIKGGHADPKGNSERHCIIIEYPSLLFWRDYSKDEVDGVLSEARDATIRLSCAGTEHYLLDSLAPVEFWIGEKEVNEVAFHRHLDSVSDWMTPKPEDE